MFCYFASVIGCTVRALWQSDASFRNCPIESGRAAVASIAAIRVTGIDDILDNAGQGAAGSGNGCDDKQGSKYFSHFFFLINSQERFSIPSRVDHPATNV